jgi:hypothetical protein
MFNALIGLDWSTIWISLASLVTAATAIAALTPTKSDDRFLGVMLKVVNFFAGNFGHNRNADDN